jgi:hypothetical protein
MLFIRFFLFWNLCVNVCLDVMNTMVYVMMHFHVCTKRYKRACVYIYINVYINVYIYMCICICIYIYIYHFFLWLKHVEAGVAGASAVGCNAGRWPKPCWLVACHWLMWWPSMPCCRAWWWIIELGSSLGHQMKLRQSWWMFEHVVFKDSYQLVAIFVALL